MVEKTSKFITIEIVPNAGHDKFWYGKCLHNRFVVDKLWSPIENSSEFIVKVEKSLCFYMNLRTVYKNHCEIV